MKATLGANWQDLADAIWNELITACDAYFINGETVWAGNRAAPEWPDAVVAAQFKRWNGYQRDTGAMLWRNNGSKDRVFDFESLPPAWQRAVCERVWVLCRDAELDKDEAFVKDANEVREELNR